MAWVLSSFTNRVLSKLDFVIWCSLLCVKRPVDFTLYACVCVCLKFPCVFTYHVNRELMDFVNIIFCALVIFAKRGWRSYHSLIFLHLWNDDLCRVLTCCITRIPRPIST